jgi:uncharacterized SAM-binding protein YcdF (DUF218 family)
MKALAVSLGVPAEAIILEEKAANTYENVKFVKDILAGHQWRTILLVSSPYHMRRAALTFRKIAPGISIINTPVPESSFYGRAQGITFAQARGILHEYLGIFYYWWKGRISL